jgi:hypothetical protein
VAWRVVTDLVAVINDALRVLAKTSHRSEVTPMAADLGKTQTWARKRSHGSAPGANEKNRFTLVRVVQQTASDR